MFEWLWQVIDSGMKTWLSQDHQCPGASAREAAPGIHTSPVNRVGVRKSLFQVFAWPSSLISVSSYPKSV